MKPLIGLSNGLINENLGRLMENEKYYQHI